MRSGQRLGYPASAVRPEVHVASKGCLEASIVLAGFRAPRPFLDAYIGLYAMADQGRVRNSVSHMANGQIDHKTMHFVENTTIDDYPGRQGGCGHFTDARVPANLSRCY